MTLEELEQATKIEAHIRAAELKKYGVRIARAE